MSIVDRGLKEEISSDGLAITKDVEGGMKLLVAELPLGKQIMVGFFNNAADQLVLWIENKKEERLLLKRWVTMDDVQAVKKLFRKQEN